MPIPTGWPNACRRCGCSPARRARSGPRRTTASPPSSARFRDIAEAGLVETRSRSAAVRSRLSLLPSAALTLRPLAQRSGAQVEGLARALRSLADPGPLAASRRAASFSICAASRTRRHSSSNSPQFPKWRWISALRLEARRTPMQPIVRLARRVHRGFLCGGDGSIRPET